MIKHTDKTLKQLQIILKEGGYQIRKGRGAFNTGYCILEAKRVVVLNHYHSIEAKINALIEIVNKVTLNQENFSPPSAKLFKAVWEEGKGTAALKEEETIVSVDSNLEYPDLSKYKVDAKKEKAKTEADIRAEIEAELAAKEAGIDPTNTNAEAVVEGEDAVKVEGEQTLEEVIDVEEKENASNTDQEKDSNSNTDTDTANKQEAKAEAIEAEVTENIPTNIAVDAAIDTNTTTPIEVNEVTTDVNTAKAVTEAAATQELVGNEEVAINDNEGEDENEHDNEGGSEEE